MASRTLGMRSKDSWHCSCISMFKAAVTDRFKGLLLQALKPYTDLTVYLGGYTGRRKASYKSLSRILHKVFAHRADYLV